MYGKARSKGGLFCCLFLFENVEHNQMLQNVKYYLDYVEQNQKRVIIKI